MCITLDTVSFTVSNDLYLLSLTEVLLQLPLITECLVLLARCCHHIVVLEVFSSLATKLPCSFFLQLWKNH